MTAFLWTIVILMAAALLVEILAFVGLALVARRAARRADEIREQLTQKVEPSVRLAKDLQRSLQPRVETVSREGKEIAVLTPIHLEQRLQDEGRKSGVARAASSLDLEPTRDVL